MEISIYLCQQNKYKPNIRMSTKLKSLLQQLLLSPRKFPVELALGVAFFIIGVWYIETHEWSEKTLRYESDVNGDILYFFVFCWIIYSCCGQSFFALYTGAALATMLVATTIARPSLSIVQA